MPGSLILYDKLNVLKKISSFLPDKKNKMNYKINLLKAEFKEYLLRREFKKLTKDYLPSLSLSSKQISKLYEPKYALLRRLSSMLIYTLNYMTF